MAPGGNHLISLVGDNDRDCVVGYSVNISHTSLQVGSVAQPISRRPFTAARADDGGSPGYEDPYSGQHDVGIAVVRASHDFGLAVVRASSVIRGWGPIYLVAPPSGDRGAGGAITSPGRHPLNNISKKVSSSSTLSLSSLFFCPPMSSMDVF